MLVINYASNLFPEKLVYKRISFYVEKIFKHKLIKKFFF